MLSVKDQFPIFSTQSELVYLDSSATALKPERVVQKELEYYKEYSANINRGIYKLSERATEAYEEARRVVGEFVGANSREIVFVRNATEAINLVAYSWGRANLKRGDEIALTVMEHHANLVCWQELAKELGLILKFLEVDGQGKLELTQEKLGGWLSSKTKLVAFTHASNVLGTINEARAIVEIVRKLAPGAAVLIDGAQAVPQFPVSVLEIGADFYVFSGHKMYGPTGIGVLWGREELLKRMPPFEFGGDMIEEVRLEGSTYKEPPIKFEAGTPNIAGAIGMGEAVRFLTEIGMKAVRGHEMEVTQYALDKLGQISGLKVLGPSKAEDRVGLVAFTIEGIHPHDLAQLLDEEGVAIRSGHHCAMPLHTSLKIAASARASFGIYTTKGDIDKLVQGIIKARQRLS